MIRAPTSGHVRLLDSIGKHVYAFRRLADRFRKNPDAGTARELAASGLTIARLYRELAPTTGRMRDTYLGIAERYEKESIQWKGRT